MRVALYARVSTLNGQNPETQLVELREYTSHRGWEAAGEYIDSGVSGSKDSRPALNRLMAHAHQRRFDAILVWKLDRFGRSLRHLVSSLAQLESLGVTFVSLRDNWDLSTPSGRLMFQIIGAMAEFERELIRERIKAGMRRRRLEGLPLGRAPLAIDREALVRDRHSMSLTKVAKKYGCSRATVVRFTREASQGEVAQEARLQPVLAAQAPAQRVA